VGTARLHVVFGSLFAAGILVRGVTGTP